jgi:hypothetical protein
VPSMPPNLPEPPRRRVELHDANRTRPSLAPLASLPEPEPYRDLDDLPDELRVRYDGVLPLVLFVLLVIGLLAFVLWVLPYLLV